MTTSCPVPSQVEPEGLADLIADAQLITLPRQASAEPVPGLPPAQGVAISSASVSLVEGYADYGV
jgi:hypothetical protein